MDDLTLWRRFGREETEEGTEQLIRAADIEKSVTNANSE
jgi:hypothetical protein